MTCQNTTLWRFSVFETRRFQDFEETFQRKKTILQGKVYRQSQLRY